MISTVTPVCLIRTGAFELTRPASRTSGGVYFLDQVVLLTTTASTLQVTAFPQMVVLVWDGSYWYQQQWNKDRFFFISISFWMIIRFSAIKFNDDVKIKIDSYPQISVRNKMINNKVIVVFSRTNNGATHIVTASTCSAISSNNTRGPY